MYPQRHCKRTEKETRPSISEMSLLKRKGIQRLHPTVKKVLLKLSKKGKRANFKNIKSHIYYYIF